MDERHDPQTNAPDEGELLAAYLDAETDDMASARVERLLRQDPQAAAKLDALAHTRARLQRLDDVAPPEGYRERLDARLRAERTPGARHGDVRRAPVARQAGGRARWWNDRVAQLVAVAAVVLLAVVGGAALLNLSQVGSGDAASGGAEIEARAPADSDSAQQYGADDRGSEAAESLAEGGGTGAIPSGAAQALPQVSTDADIAARLHRRTQSTDDPAASEAELRQRAGMPATPVCLRDIDAAAVDLVELDGQPVLTALVTHRDGARVAIFDPQACARLRTFTP
jgi:hypothetical protein